MNSNQLLLIMPYSGRKATSFAAFLSSTMNEFQINTSLRQAAFLAQIGHESGQLRYVQEIASGISYEGRIDLGNTQIGDGKRFKGRGLIQITGRTNYLLCGKALDLDLEKCPELLEETENACRSAGWFWKTHDLNELADIKDLKKITKKINGGLNGFEDRQALYLKALEVLGE